MSGGSPAAQPAPRSPLRPAGQEVVEEILEVRDLVRSFGGVRALTGCSFGVERGSITALIGPNGAGKTTLVNVVAGAIRPQGGKVIFDGRDVTGKPSHDVALGGLIRTFQISREYPAMTVLENLMVSPQHQAGEKLATVLFRPGKFRAEERAHVQRAVEVLAEFGLYEKRNDYARALSGGQKRLLELARAVMADPKMLVLDEPMAGINPALIERLADHIIRLRDTRGTTFLMVEHNLDVVEKMCDRAVVMAVGQTLATGTMAELRGNSEVVSAYLTGGVVEVGTRE
ncbi:MAG: ABC transporter ATP-binding protein [Acidimicrobiales bacterium]